MWNKFSHPIHSTDNVSCNTNYPPLGSWSFLSWVRIYFPICMLDINPLWSFHLSTTGTSILMIAINECRVYTCHALIVRKQKFINFRVLQGGTSFLKTKLLSLTNPNKGWIKASENNIVHATLRLRGLFFQLTKNDKNFPMFDFAIRILLTHLLISITQNSCAKESVISTLAVDKLKFKR